MAEEQKRKKKWAYLEDFHKNSKGGYEYHGKYFRCVNGTEIFMRARRKMVAACVLAFVCTVAAGCIPAPGMTGTFYMILPYVLALVCTVSMGWALGRLNRGGIRLRKYIYEETVKKIPYRAGSAVILNTAAALSGLFFLIWNGMGDGGVWSFAFCVLEGASAAGAFLVFRIAGTLQWQKESTDESML